MKLLIAAGGTAGHINPAIAIAKAVKKRDKNAQILFVGTADRMESELVPREGFDIEFIDVKGFKRSLSPQNAIIAYKAAKGVFDAANIVKKFKPDVVVGCGGYASGPAVFYAALKGIPTLVHEQNVFPGLTTRILSRFVNVVAISFEETVKYLPKKVSTFMTGNPVRQALLKVKPDDAKLQMVIDERPCILAFGGSLGSSAINNAILEILPKLQGKVQIIWGTGKTKYEQLKAKYDAMGSTDKGIKISPYIYNMDTAMAAADLVISRSGAITLGELCALGKPSILIPSPNVTHNHQEYNARALGKNGAAKVLLEAELTPQRLLAEIEDLLFDKQKINKMAQSAKNMGITDADNKLCNRLFEMIKKGNT